YAPTPPARAARQVIRFGQTRQPSYAWSFDRGDGWCNVGYGELLRPRRPAPTRALMLEEMEELLPGATSGAQSWLGHHLPLSPARWQQPDGRVLLAGDAASLVNPLTGEGIYYAVATGALAGETAVRSACAQAGARHRARVRRLLGAHLLTTAAVSRVVHARGVLPAGLRAASADQAVFDELVEVGLGRGLLSPRTVGRLLRQGAADVTSPRVPGSSR
ncbi:MAG: hyaluronate lyase, partial [Actinobacteria bacterium]|nr:hyaluronate lyase [Actinomycetota bacterium]